MTSGNAIRILNIGISTSVAGDHHSFSRQPHKLNDLFVLVEPVPNLGVHSVRCLSADVNPVMKVLEFMLRESSPTEARSLVFQLECCCFHPAQQNTRTEVQLMPSLVRVAASVWNCCTMCMLRMGWLSPEKRLEPTGLYPVY